MADTPEAIALRLHGFIQAAKRKALAGPAQGEYPPGMRARPKSCPIVGVYEECVGTLEDRDRAELVRIIGMMEAKVGIT